MKRGAMLLEYAILLIAMIPVVAAVSYAVVSPSGELGPLGLEMQQFFMRLVSVVAVPYP